MTNRLGDFNSQSANWRQTLRDNSRRTYYVMISFFIIYAALGFLIDVIRLMEMYRIPLETACWVLVKGEAMPYAMGVCLLIAACSLLITLIAHNKLMLMGTQYHQVTIESQDLSEKQLFNIVEEMKIASGLNYMPKIFIIEAHYMNAFASGFSEKSAMVAITRGLLEKLDRDEIQAVMAHELSHIRHQDIKLTLIASVLSNLILIIIDRLFYSMIYGKKDKADGRIVLVVMVLRFALPIITGLLMLYLSRKREFMADAGAVELMRSNQPMARALLKIHNDHQDNIDELSQDYGKTKHEEVRRAAYLYDPVATGVEPTRSFMSLFSTHPDLYARLKAIGFELKKVKH